MRKWFVFVLVIMMLMNVMFTTGCTSKDKGGSNEDAVVSGETSTEESSEEVSPKEYEPDEIVEIEFMRFDPSWDPIEWGEDPVTREITKRTGVRLKCLAPSGEGDQVANVMLLSGDYPEIINGYSLSMYAKYVAAGVLWSFDELCEKYNYPEILDGTRIPKASIAVHRSQDGKLYGIPEWFSEDGFGSVGQSLCARNDIYKELGQPNFKTMDEFYEALKTIRDSYATYKGVKMWPLAIHWMDTAMLGDVANIYGANIYRFIYYNENTKKVELFLRAPELVKAVQFLNICYNEKLLDPECFTFDSTQMTEAYSTGKYAFIFTWFWNLWTPEAILTAEDPEQYYVAIDIPQGTPGKQQYFGYIHTGGDLGVSITKNCKNLEAAIRFIDFCLSDEGQILDFYGVEGETMEFRDGVPYLLEGVYEAKLADWSGYGKKTGVRLWDRMKNQKWNWERQVEAPQRAANRAMSAKYAFDATFLKALQVDSTTPEGILYAEIETNIIPQLTEIIVDSKPTEIESKIQELLKYYESKGLSALEDAWTEHYNRIINAIE